MVKVCAPQSRGPELGSTGLTQVPGDCGILPIIPASEAHARAGTAYSHTETKNQKQNLRALTPRASS